MFRRKDKSMEKLLVSLLEATDEMRDSRKKEESSAKERIMFLLYIVAGGKVDEPLFIDDKTINDARKALRKMRKKADFHCFTSRPAEDGMEVVYLSDGDKGKSWQSDTMIKA